MRMCNAESQKSSAKGSNFKEDDSALPLYELLLYSMIILSLLYPRQYNIYNTPALVYFRKMVPIV